MDLQLNLLIDAKLVDAIKRSKEASEAFLNITLGQLASARPSFGTEALVVALESDYGITLDLTQEPETVEEPKTSVVDKNAEDQAAAEAQDRVEREETEAAAKAEAEANIIMHVDPAYPNGENIVSVNGDGDVTVHPAPSESSDNNSGNSEPST